MVSATLFIFHIIACLYAFLKFKKESLSDGFLAVGLMIIVFAVGWTITTMITNLIFTPDWFIRWYYKPLESTFWQVMRKEFNRDTISLVLLTFGEAFFYVIFFFPSISGKKKSTDQTESNAKENKT
ncbi:MAG: hypothetical protein KBG83_02620 [Bacteroidetes bacterium]|nr:hypothetical protein [Bacteroidota bacterium]